MSTDEFTKKHTARYFLISSVDDIKGLLQCCFGEALFTCILVTVFLRLFPLTTDKIPNNKQELNQIEKRKYIHALFVGLTIIALSGVL